MLGTDLKPQDVLPWRDPAYVRDPYPFYALARRDHPIYRSLDGAFVVTRYEDVVRYGKLPSLSIVDPQGISGPWASFKDTVLNMDPPKHTEVRRRSNKWFTPKLVAQWVQALDEVLRACLDEVVEGEVFDANMVFGVGPTHAAMCRALQVPADAFEPVIHSMHKTMAALSAVATPQTQDRAQDAFDYLFKRMRALIAYKRAHPGDGMADAMLAAQDSGEMTEAEVIQALTLFWASGGHNPSYAISSGIEYFARHPDAWTGYRTDPGMRMSFMGEMFRLNPPELFFTRFATEPLEIRGVEIRPGERILFVIDSANRDADVFPDPDRVDLSRPPETAQHVTFGIGTHACAGQVISRAEVDTAYRILAERVTSFRLEGEPVLDATDRSRAYVDLPISIRF